MVMGKQRLGKDPGRYGSADGPKVRAGLKPGTRDKGKESSELRGWRYSPELRAETGQMRKEMSCGQENKSCCPSHLLLQSPAPKGKLGASNDWQLDPAELASKFTPRTKVLVLNTPNNPLGKVFSRMELELVANLCQQHDVVCISDEVYQWLVYDGQQHISIASLPGMWDRTLTIGSAGKSFSATGWKVSVSTWQAAAAGGLRKASSGPEDPAVFRSRWAGPWVQITS